MQTTIDGFFLQHYSAHRFTGIQVISEREVFEVFDFNVLVESELLFYYHHPTASEYYAINLRIADYLTL